jgi:hypothetical protein
MATATVGPSKDYATVTAWEAAVQGTLSEIQIASVYGNGGGAYTDAPIIGGSTTDASNYMQIESAAGEEFSFDRASLSGVWWDRNGTGHSWQITDAYVRVVGTFGITNSSPGSSDEGIHINSGGTPFLLENTMIYDLTAGDCDGIYMGNQNQDLTVKNCAFVDIHRAGIHFQHYSGGPFTQVGTIVNCAFHGMGTTGGGTREGCAIGYRCTNSSSTLDVKIINCFNIKSAGSEHYDIRQTNSSSNGTETFTGDFNASEQANQAASGFPDDATNSIFNVTAKRRADLTTETTTHLVVETWDDLHIVDDTSKTYTNALQGGGVGPSADSDVPTTDVDGDTRSGATTDIGMDVIAAAGGVLVTPATGQVTLGAAAGAILAGSLSLTPATGQVTLGAAPGAVVAGSISLTPATSQTTLGAAVGGVIAGSLTATPATAQITLGATTTALLGSLSVAPVTAQITLGATAGATLAGSLSLTPATSQITLGATSGSIVAGSLTATPATAQITLGAAVTILVGEPSITPATAQITLGAAVGGVSYGSISIPPASAILAIQSAAGGIELSSVVVAPASAILTIGASGSVVESGLALTPDTASISLLASMGSILYGSAVVSPATAPVTLGADGTYLLPVGITLSPARAILDVLAAGSAIGGGFVYVSPNTAQIVLGAQIGTIATSGLICSPTSAVLDLKGYVGAVDSEEGLSLGLASETASLNLLAAVGGVDANGPSQEIEEAGYFCPPNPALLFELYHPANDIESEKLLVTERIHGYGLDERILIRKPSGTVGYMRPLYCRFFLEDSDAATTCIGKAMVSIVFGRMK